MAKIRGTMYFDELTSVGIQLIQDFQAKYASDFKYSFGPTPSTASISWESMQKLRLLNKLAIRVTIRDTS
jgi:hypothetical protein